MSSLNYQVLRKATLAAQQVKFSYQGLNRLACPHVLGLKHGREKALVFQFAGQSSRGLTPGGEWRCVFVDEIFGVTANDGEWHTDYNHSRRQTCIDQVDVELWVPSSGTPYVRKA